VINMLRSFLLTLVAPRSVPAVEAQAHNGKAVQIHGCGIVTSGASIPPGRIDVGLYFSVSVRRHAAWRTFGARLQNHRLQQRLSPYFNFASWDEALQAKAFYIEGNPNLRG
jgi:hypothetical protein